MKSPKFKPGQIVYVLGQYRAKVISCGNTSVECDVYEGLEPHTKAPERLSYFIDLVHAKKSKA